MANNSDSASEVQHTKEGVNTPPPFVQIDVNPLGVFNSVPQYSEPALESGIHVLPSRYSETTFIPDLPEVLGPSTPVGDPQSDSHSINSELYGNYENIDNLPSVGQEAHGDSVYSEEHDADPPRSTDPQEVLLRIKEQASAHVRAQKNQHIRDLALKKLKLQQLLLKLDTITGSEDPLSGSQYSLEEEELLSMADSGVEGRAPLGSEDRQREGEDESNTEDRDECDHAMHRSRQMMHSCWRRIFQAIGFPLSFTSVLIIELVSFISQYVVEMLIVGLVTVLGKRMIAPLFGTLYSHVIQPLARLLINISVAVRNILRPLLAVVRYTILHVALLVRSFRLVEVHSTAAQRPHSRQEV